MYRIAVIDDGVSIKTIPDIMFDLDMTAEIPNPEKTISEDSHGTICASIIKLYAPMAAIGSIKILDDETKTGFVDNLCKALDWCIENEIALINISLGSVYSIDYQKLKEKTDLARTKGIVIVAALNNKGKISYPASLPNVIGVKTDESLQNDEYVMCKPNIEGVDVCASSRHPLTIQQISHFSIGNSYAAPLIAAKIWHIMMQYNNTEIDDIKNCLNMISFRENKNYNSANYAAIDFYDYCVKPYLFSDANIMEPDIPCITIMYNQNSINRVLNELSRLFYEEEYNTILISTCYDELPENVYYIPAEKLNDKVISFIYSKHESNIILLGTSFVGSISQTVTCDLLFLIRSANDDENITGTYKDISFECLIEHRKETGNIPNTLFSEIICLLE